MDHHDEVTAAVIELHGGLERQGPGDTSFSRQILSCLPALRPSPRIADLGCGTGAGTLLLAETFRVPIISVDLCQPFLDQLTASAKLKGLDEFVRPTHADIGKLDWPPASLDLLWSEGAAYNLEFAKALEVWRPFIRSEEWRSSRNSFGLWTTLLGPQRHFG